MIVYRLLLLLVSPVMAALFLWRVLRGQECWCDVRERLGHACIPDDPTGRGPVQRLWLHAASVGELTAARPLIEELLSRSAQIHIVITTNTVTGRDFARGWGEPRVAARLAPLDYGFALRRFLHATRPSAFIVIENELWPNRLRAVHDLGCPVALVGARISGRSARRWHRVGGLLRNLLAGVSFAVTQDAASAQALEALGVPQDRIAPPVSLKAAVVLPRPDPEAVAALGFERAETLLAASTHEGEEAQILAAYQTARAQRPQLRLILAPRHPTRGPDVAAMVAATGLPHAVRSRGQSPEGADIYLADTLGEMSLWYSAAGLCFVGGSLVLKGGHTPYEPAQFGCALVTGPHVENAAAAYATLKEADAVAFVDGKAALAAQLAAWTPDAQRAAGARARAALAGAVISPLADQLAGALGLDAKGAPPRRP